MSFQIFYNITYCQSVVVPTVALKLHFLRTSLIYGPGSYYHTTKLLLKERYAVLILSQLSHSLIISLLFIVP